MALYKLSSNHQNLGVMKIGYFSAERLAERLTEIVKIIQAVCSSPLMSKKLKS